MIKKYCLICGKEFLTKPCRKNIAKYCSIKCYGISNVGKIIGRPSEETIQKIKKTSKGKHYSPETEFKKGNNNLNWNNGKYLYSSVHHWIRKKKGKPQFCSNCGDTSKKRRIEWANINHTYKRNVDDYISLCIPCHKKYDLKMLNSRLVGCPHI